MERKMVNGRTEETKTWWRPGEGSQACYTVVLGHSYLFLQRADIEIYVFLG